MIRAADYQSKFSSEPHLNLWIDGEPIQEWLQRLVPESGAEDLVPAWLGWLNDPAEQEIVRERMVPRLGERQFVPLLVCPDDLDFSCTVIIAEVNVTEEEVIWERIGLNATRSAEPSEVGSQVNWFPVPPVRFPREEYLGSVKQFEGVLDTSCP